MIQFTLSKIPKTKDESNPHDTANRGSTIRIPKLDNYDDLKTIITDPKSTIALGNPLSKFNEGDKLIYASSPNNGKDGYFVRSKSSFEDTINVAVLDLEQVSVVGDKCNDYRLTSKKKVIKFMTKYFTTIKNYTITKSYSQIDGNNKHKWHVYILFAERYKTQDIETYIKAHLPEHSFVLGLTKNGSQKRTNAFLDLAVFDATNRLMYEHPDVNKHMHHEGRNTPNKVSDFTEVVKAFTEPFYRPIFSEKERKLRKKKHIKNYALKNNISIKKAKHIIKRFEKGSTLSYSMKMMLSDGSCKSVGDIVCENKVIRLYPPIDIGNDGYSSAMAYYPQSKTFKDFHNGIIYDAASRVIEDYIFEGKYKKHIEFNHRVTLEIAPTGSGKTYQFNDKGNTIILVPKNSMVDQHKGIKAGKGWDIFENRPTVMTYDKFEGHMLCETPPDLSNIILVVDEVHTLTKRPIFDNLIRDKSHLNVKQLILMSATPHIAFYEKYVDCIITHRKKGKKQIVKYINMHGNKEPHYILSLKGNVMVYKQDKMKNEVLAQWLRSQGKRVLVLNRDTKIPKKLFEKHDIVITTSTLREGFNITEYVNHMVVLGGRKVTVEDTVQFIARARKNVPEVHIPVNGKFAEGEIKIPDYSKYRYMALKLGNALETDRKRQLIAVFDAYEDLRKSAIVAKTGEFDEVGLQLYYKKRFDKCAKDSFNFRKKAFKHWGNYKVIQVKALNIKGISFRRNSSYTKDLIAKYPNYEELITYVKDRLTMQITQIERIELNKILEKHEVIQWHEGWYIHTVKNPHAFLLDNKLIEELKQFRLNKQIDYVDNKPLKIGSSYKEKTLKDNVRKYIRKQGDKSLVDLEYALIVARKKYRIGTVIKDNEAIYHVKGALFFPTDKSVYSYKKISRASKSNAQNNSP